MKTLKHENWDEFQLNSVILNMRHFARLGTICTILKKVKNTHVGVIL